MSRRHIGASQRSLFRPANVSLNFSFVQVHQTGYVASAPKRAYLMSFASSTGSSFSVLDSTGSAVFSAALGPSQGSWGTFTHVYALDFDSVSTTGTYTVVNLRKATVSSLVRRLCRTCSDFCESSQAYEQPMKSMRATLVVAPAVTVKG
jgi:Cellulase N-terminal ig-like domain